MFFDQADGRLGLNNEDLDLAGRRARVKAKGSPPRSRWDSPAEPATPPHCRRPPPPPDTATPE
ncbi:hypothetical protein ABZ260_45635, partial [Streptosporangium sp. NPDC006013]|uniref:hypothetical protein n=1 Tax=Streptosporangium sp. NPDC006013 TaxID=3155596 RepID=UPI0033A51B34